MSDTTPTNDMTGHEYTAREDEPSRMTARLRHLVAIESPSADTQASAAMADTLCPALASAGATVSRVPSTNGVHIVARIPGQLPGTILLLGHSDTVWDIGTLGGTVPWREFRTESGAEAIAGPGVFDMKSGLVIMETALARLRAAGRPHPSITVLITCDEEIGSPTSTALVAEEAARADAVVGFESPHPDGALKVGRKGSTRLRLSVTGREAHAALDPEKGVNAIDELVDQLASARAIAAAALEKRPGGLLYNLGGIDGGGRANVVPGQSSALLGLRFTDQDTEREVLANFRALTAIRSGAVIATSVLSQRPVWRATPADMALAEAIGVHGRPAAGAADTNTTGAMGIATVDGMGPMGGGAHAVGEHLLVSSFVERAAQLTAFLSAPIRRG